MEKHKLVVPDGVRYIGDWKEYRLEDYPFPHILNKELTGCGYTEFCIRNEQDLILVSPRKFLLQNKKDQHPGEVFYVCNDLEISSDYELDISKDDTAKIKKKAEANVSGSSSKTTLDNLRELKTMLKDHVTKCAFSKIPCKILVTYDSFRHVKEALGDNIRNFQIVVDEFQSIFMDSRFKSTTELEFMNQLNGYEKIGGIKIEKVCFVSATPMIDKYLEMVPEFKHLPYYELDWETDCPGRTKRPKLEVKISYRSLNQEAKQVIQKYRKGEKIEESVNPITGKLVQSREAVLFMNSIGGICQAIRTNELLPEECNIICADTTENNKDLRNAFNVVYDRLDKDKPLSERRKLSTSAYLIGSIPLKGEPHKMFTFCTRTVYLGADFYSTNARTFIFSDSNVDCLSVDISMDLEQILGRQRLDENPWKNSATLIIKTTKDKKKMSQEDFDSILKTKIQWSDELIAAYNEAREELKPRLVDKYLSSIKTEHYSKDYVAVNHFIDENDKMYLKPVFNNLMYISELRAFEVQQKDYKDRFTVFATIEGEGIESASDIVIEYFDKFTDFKDVTNKLKVLVEFSELNNISETDVTHFLGLIPGKYKDYYEIVTPERIRANSYKEADIKRELKHRIINDSVSDKLTEEIYKTFEVGKRYTKADIKEKLKKLYSDLGYTKTAKATDLDVFFYLKAILTSDKKNGFEIIAKK